MARILIVDDVTSIREIVLSMLQKKGHRMFEAKTGKEALEIAKTKRVHLVLTDINMPTMDGIELIGKLREIEHYAKTPIVVLARGAKDENLER